MVTLSILDQLLTYYAKVYSYPFIIQVCILFIIGCIVLFFSFLAIIAYSRYRHFRLKAKELRLLPPLDELILKHLLDEKGEEFGVIQQEFTQCMGTLNNENLDIITDRLIFYKNNFDLNVNDAFYRIIEAVGIEKHIEKKLQFTSSFSKMKGIQALSNLAITAAESNIFPFTYSRNLQVRKEARTSYLRLSKNDPYKFLDEAKERFNAWDQINLLKQLLGMDKQNLPSFSKWIAYSENESIVEFAIRMTSYFQQRDAIPVLTQQLNSPKHQLRAEAIKALGELEAKETESTLITIYNNQPDNCQMEIIRAIGKFKTGLSLDFIVNAWEKSHTVETQKVAAEALLNYNEEGQSVFNSLKIKTLGIDQTVLQHVENPLIKFK